MTSDFERNLEKYAEVVVKVGLNLQPGQRLLIGCPAFGIYGVPLELFPFIRLITRQAYRAGARLVDVIWNDDQMRLIRFQETPSDSMDEFPEWRSNAVYEAVKSGDAILNFLAEDPELLKDQDPELVGLFQATNWKHISATMALLGKNATNWCVATAPVEGWTDMLFPSLPPEDRNANFWDTIFEICRIKEDDPVAVWEKHLTDLSGRAGYLNQKKYSELKYTAPGTDLLVGLPQGHLWKSGRMTSQNGIDFTANIVTEEVFTLPHRSKVEGFVTSSKPLGYGGMLIEEFTLSFSGGKVAEIKAKKNEDVLRSLIETDNGAARLGEVALVPHSSPISQTGMLFNNLLLDENASSHLALGFAYKFCVENGDEMTDDDFAVIGGNQSLAHVDFMIGSDKMDIDGITEDGSADPVMRGGEWAFDI